MATLNSSTHLELADLDGSIPKLAVINSAYKAHLHLLYSSKNEAKRLVDSITKQILDNKNKHETELAENPLSVLPQIHDNVLANVYQVMEDFAEEKKTCIGDIKAMIKVATDNDVVDSRTVDKCRDRLEQIGQISTDLNYWPLLSTIRNRNICLSRTTDLLFHSPEQPTRPPDQLLL